MTSTISTYGLSAALQQSIFNAQQQLVTTEQEVSTGTYADIGLQLGAATGQDISLRAQESLLQTITDSNNTTSTRVSSTQTVLSNLQSTAQNFLQTLISTSAQNGASNALQALGQSGLQSLTQELNSSVGGQYIFGGINTGTPPITNYYGSSAANATAVDNAFTSYFGFSASSSSVSSITSAQMQDFLTN